MRRYNPKEIEPKWQAEWAESKIYEASEDPAKPKRYILEYFPYPSGAAMHVGHVRNYTIGDVVARHARMRGMNVLHPMGWDAFGLPAENYAIKSGISPQQAIKENTGKFKQQLMSMGFSYDWSREFASSDPDYYKWTQWFFLLLHKRGLAYRQESLQWWCPVDKTVLANEQVENGHCWRCGSEVEKKALKQWFFKITDYADRLAKDLDDVDWSDGIKQMQRNWIGRSTGAEVTFAIDDSDQKVTVFTTRPDTLFGATFMVLAPEHPVLDVIVPEGHRQQVENYREKVRNKSDIERQETNREKTGVFSGAYAINPVNGEKIPVWTADYVLMGYGTGAIMAVPAHDERDNAFAKKFNLPIKPVVAEAFGEYRPGVSLRPSVIVLAHDPSNDKYCVLSWQPRQGVHGKNGLELPGGGLEEGESIEQAALREFTEETGYTDVAFEKTLPFMMALDFAYLHEGQTKYKRALKSLALLTVNSLQQASVETHDDYEKDASVVWLTKDELLQPGKLPLDKAAFAAAFTGEIFNGDGIVVNSGPYDGLPSAEVRGKIVTDLEAKGSGREKVNYRVRDWLISRQRYWGAPIPMIHCPKDGVVPVPEDQLPIVLPELTKFEPSGDGRSPLANIPEFVNVDCPKCGGPAERETDTMDGFACSSWYFLRFADPHNNQKAFDADKVKFWLPVDDYIGGAEHAVMHLLYARMWTKVMQDEGLIDFGEPFKALRNQGMILAPDGQKMSKSKGNTIQPDELIDQGYGADSIRIMELFIGPWNQSANWSVEGMGGSYRFLQRVWNLVQEHVGATEHSSIDSDELMRAVHRTTKKVSDDLADMGFNTAIAALMELVNDMYRLKTQVSIGASIWKDSLETLVQLLAPFAPHIAEELWQQLGHEDSVHTSTWPMYDEKYLVQNTITIAVQVNGKLRSTVTAPPGTSEEVATELAKGDTKIAANLEGKQIVKTIYVSDKLLNFVVK